MQRTIIGIRKDMQLDRYKFAELIGCKPSSLARYEQFKQVPPVDVAIQIMKVAKITNVDEIKWAE